MKRILCKSGIGIPVLAVLVLMLSLAAREAGARGGRRYTLPELAKGSKVIATGVVGMVGTSGEIMEAAIKVTKVIRGAAGDSITVINSSRGCGQARFREGENVLLFLIPAKEKGAFVCLRGAAGMFTYLPKEDGRLYLLVDEAAGFAGSVPDKYLLRKHYGQLTPYIEKPLSDRRLLAALLEELDGTETIVRDVISDDLLLTWLRDDGMDTLVHSWSMGQLGRRGVKKAALEIADRVSAKHPHTIRVHAMAALGDLGPEGQTGALTAALNDDEADIRGAAAHALGGLRYPDTMAVYELVKCFEEETDIFVRLSIVTSLGEIPGDEAKKALAGMGGSTVEECIVSLVEDGDEDSENYDKYVSSVDSDK